MKELYIWVCWVTDRVYRMGSEGAVYMGTRSQTVCRGSEGAVYMGRLTVTDRVYRMGSEGAVYMGS